MKRDSARPRRAERSQRQLRIGEMLRHVLAGLLERGDIRDPDLAGSIITVSEIRVSADLGNATAYVLPLGGQDAPRIIAALRRAAPYLRHEMARQVNLRRMPALGFEFDTSFDEASHIDSLLRSPTVARDLTAPDADAPPDPAPSPDGGDGENGA